MFMDGSSMPSGGSTSTSSLGDYAQQLGLPLGGSQYVSPTGDPMQRPIFISWQYANRQQFESGDPSLQTAQVKTVAQLLAEFESGSKEEQHHTAALLALSGYAGNMRLSDVNEWVQEASYPQVVDAYKGFLDDLASRYQVGDHISPDAMLQAAIGYRFKSAGVKWNGELDSINVDGLGDLLKGIGTDLSGTTTRTETEKTIDFLDPQDAKALTRGMLQQELGRDPTKAEYEDFLSMLHAAQAEDPTVSKKTTTTTTDAEGNVVDVNSNVTKRMGIGATGLGQLAQDQAQAQPDWAEWQAMGTYFPALLSALGSTVPGT